MSAGTPPPPTDLAQAIMRLVEWAQATAPIESAFVELLARHFGEDPSTFPVAGETFPAYDRANLQLALDAYIQRDGRSSELVGIGASDYVPVSLAAMVQPSPVHRATFRPGPVDYVVFHLGREESMTCVRAGLYLIDEGGERLAVLVGRRDTPMAMGRGIGVEVMAKDRGVSERFLRDLGALMSEHNVFRGRVISLAQEQGPHGGEVVVTFHDLPDTGRGAIVLPDGALERIERNTLTFSEKAEELLRAGRHLRRGLLLHGPPGTGKTLTAKYLASRLEGRTVLLLTGSGLGMIGPSCALARDLQPSMVVLEDVDLVAQERTTMGLGATALLFQLLNEMDGLSDDADIVFLLTTNRADLLEPALATRPGRVDLAVELPLPDAASRGRLIELFSRGLDADYTDVGAIVERTEGASPAFLRELVRKAALLAVESDGGRVAQAHFDHALAELEEGGRLTRSLLGSGPPPGTPGGPPAAPEWGDPTGGFPRRPAA